MQAYLIAGGYVSGSVSASALTLLPGASSWTTISSLPRALYHAKASIVGGKIRVSGGRDDNNIYKAEVILFVQNCTIICTVKEVIRKKWKVPSLLFIPKTFMIF